MTNSINIPMPVKIDSTGFKAVNHAVNHKGSEDESSVQPEFNEILSTAIDSSKGKRSAEVKREDVSTEDKTVDDNHEHSSTQVPVQTPQNSESSDTGSFSLNERKLTGLNSQPESESTLEGKNVNQTSLNEKQVEKSSVNSTASNVTNQVNTGMIINGISDDKPVQSFLDGFQPTKGVFSPIKIVDRQSGSNENAIKIVNPFASRETSAVQPEVPIDVEARARDGIWQALYDANSPPVRSNAPPGEFVQPEVAGPRGNDLPKQYRSIRFTEEAKSDKTHREVSGQTISSYSWMKAAHFRQPVSEISKNSFIDSMRSSDSANSKQTDFTSVKADQQPIVKAAELNSPEVIRTAPSETPVSPPTMQSIESTVSPEKTPKNPEIRPIEVKEAVKPQDQEIKTESSVKLNTNATEGSAFNKPVTQPAISQDKPVGNADKLSPTESNAMADLNIKVVNQSIQSPSQQAPSTGGQIAMGNVSVDPSAQAVNIQPEITTFNVEEPVHILSSAPDKIASEIKMVDTKAIADGGKAILKVELNPPRLGPMEIELSKVGSEMEVKLVVRTLFARELLAHRCDEIRTALQEQGIDVKKFEIIDLNQQRQQNHQFSGFNPGETPFGKHQGEASHNGYGVNSNGDDDENITGITESSMDDQKDTIASEGVLNVLA